MISYQNTKRWTLIALGCICVSLSTACGGRLPASIPEMPSAEEGEETEESDEADVVASARNMLPAPQGMPQAMPRQALTPQQQQALMAQQQAMLRTPLPQSLAAGPPPSVQVRPEHYANPYLPNQAFNRMATPGQPPQTPGVHGSYGPVSQPQYGYTPTGGGMMPAQPGYTQQRRY